MAINRGVNLRIGFTSFGQTMYGEDNVLRAQAFQPTLLQQAKSILILLSHRQHFKGHKNLMFSSLPIERCNIHLPSE